MKLKEKCIYYNPIQEGYYLVLSKSDMVYGRSGDFAKSSNLENWIHQAGPGLKFKIDDIIINSDHIRNYYLNDKDLEKFELVKELTDEEFYPIEILSTSRYKYPSAIINIPAKEDISELIESIKYDETEINRMNQHIKELEKQLYLSMRCNIL